jgi:hypothetical protein
MSVKVMGLVWDADLARDEKFILLAYADHAEHDGSNVYPAIALVAWKTNYSDRQITRITGKLVAAKILLPSGKSHLGTIRYRINIDALPKRDDYEPKRTGRPLKGGDKMSPHLIEGGDILEKGGDILEKGRDVAMSDKPSFNPSSEPSIKPSRKSDVVFIIPDKLNTLDFIESWEAFKQQRQEKKRQVTQTAGDRLLKRLNKYPVDVAIKMLDQSTENNWQGVFEVKTNGNGNQPTWVRKPSVHPDDDLAEFKRLNPNSKLLTGETA